MSLEGYINYFIVFKFLKGIANNAIEGLRIPKDNPQAKKFIPVPYCKLSLDVTE